MKSEEGIQGVPIGSPATGRRSPGARRRLVSGAMLPFLRRVALLVVPLVLLLGFAPGQAFAAGDVVIVTIDGSINPASADYLIGAIEQAEEMHAAAVLIELDTPGGLVSATQDIIQAMLNADVPTIVFVSPRGATATSAGTFITLASTVAVMMPGTSIGAAHPVSLFGGSPPSTEPSGDEGGEPPRDVMTQKMENYLSAYVESVARHRDRNVEWAREAVRNSVAVTAEQALELGVIDLVVDSRAELLAKIDGRVVDVEGRDHTIEVAGATEVVIEKTLLQAIFDFLSDPNVATILLAIGALGLYMEFQSPGLIVPGAVGVGAFILLGFALQILPFSWVGVLFLLLGIALLVAELFVVSFGMLFAAGIACFLVGGTMVFDRPEASDLTVDFWGVLVPITAAMSVFGAVIAYSLSRTLFAQQTAGVAEMVGLVGRCETSVEPPGAGLEQADQQASAKGKVFVRGEYWNCVADEPVAVGDAVEIIDVQGLTLRVRKASPKAEPA